MPNERETRHIEKVMWARLLILHPVHKRKNTHSNFILLSEPSFETTDNGSASPRIKSMFNVRLRLITFIYVHLVARGEDSCAFQRLELQTHIKEERLLWVTCDRID